MTARRRPWTRTPVLFALALAICLVLGCPRPARAAQTAAGQDGSAAAASAVDEEAGFGLADFVRNNAGTTRPVDGVDLGYRYPRGDDDDIVVVNTPSEVVVHVDAATAERYGLGDRQGAGSDALRGLIESLDQGLANGGAVLAESDKPWSFTTQDRCTVGDFAYYFDVECAGRRYVSVVPAGFDMGACGEASGTPTEAARARGVTLRDGALWCDTADLRSSDELVDGERTDLLDRLRAFFTGIDYRPFWVSLKTSAVAMLFTFVLGLCAAWRTYGASGRAKGVLDALFTVPMVLPPTVCGFLLMLAFGQSTAVGRWLIAHGIDIVFTWPAAVISAVVVSFPLMYRTARGAFEALDASMLDAARTLGWSEARIFGTLMMPLAWPSIAAGTVLAFARAMGEFGCTLFFAGNYAGVTQTIPIAIYFDWMGGATRQALFWVIVVIAFSFLVILLINVYAARSQAYRLDGGARTRGRRPAASRGEADARADSLEPTGGDALRIDRAALRELLGVVQEPRSDGPDRTAR